MSILWDSLPAGVLVGFIPFAPELPYLARWPAVLIGALLLMYVLRRRTSVTGLQLAGEILIVVPAYFVYFLVRGLVETREAEAFQRSIRVIEFENAVNIFWEPGLQERLLRFDLLVDFMNWTYIWGHWPVIVLAAVWLFLLHRDSYPVYRNAFIISGAMGIIIFAFLPVAPPRFMDAWGFVDTVAERSQAYRVLQPPAFINQYAAMPSLHFGWNLLVGIAIVRHASGRLLKLVGLVMPVLTFSAIVLTGNHYIVDGVAGGMLALLGLAMALMLHNVLQRRQMASDGQAVPLPTASGPGLRA
ncbi:MAG: phosphatase PAP2 family protein [Chloroflexi bacterium]|nr:phosphatase PAP2 family protein [Chloroflexota bacterium]